MAAQKYLDYSGLAHLVSNYVINKKIGTTVGDILYVSAVDANGIPTYSRLAVGANGKVLKVTNGVPAWGDDTSATYTAGTGLTLTNENVFNHSNAITAQTTQALYPIAIDAQGHISAYGNAVTSLKNPYPLKFFNNGTELSKTYDGHEAVDMLFSSKFTVAVSAAEDGGVSIDIAYSFNADQFTLATNVYSLNTITNQEINALFS